MPRISLKERERKLLFDLVCNNLIYLNDCLSQSEDEDCPEDDLKEWRASIEQADVLADKLAKAKKRVTL